MLIAADTHPTVTRLNLLDPQVGVPLHSAVTSFSPTSSRQPWPSERMHTWFIRLITALTILCEREEDPDAIFHRKSERAGLIN